MESDKHHSLVKKMYEYVCSLDFVENAFVQCDIFEVSGNVERTIEGYIPDLYYDLNSCVILGEAKTTNDIDRQHSFLQYDSYLKKLEYKSKDAKRCILIIAVPWGDSITAYRIIKRKLNNRKNIHILIINEIGIYKEYENY